jgi:HEPN domain-containing protein
MAHPLFSVLEIICDILIAAMRKVTVKWLKQAGADLKAAKDSHKDRNYEWSCFQSQQSGEKALKACLYEKGYTSIVTHSLKELLKECSKIDDSFKLLSKDARNLDMFYIPTRYPNGLGGDLAPTDFYEREDAEQCISSAELILNAVKTFLMK